MQITANLLGFALVVFHMINVSLGVPTGISNDEGKEIMNHHDANTTKLNKKVNLCLVLLYSLGGGLIKDSAYETARPIPLERTGWEYKASQKNLIFMQFSGKGITHFLKINCEFSCINYM